MILCFLGFCGLPRWGFHSRGVWGSFAGYLRPGALCCPLMQLSPSLLLLVAPPPCPGPFPQQWHLCFLTVWPLGFKRPHPSLQVLIRALFVLLAKAGCMTRPRGSLEGDSPTCPLSWEASPCGLCPWDP